jgi:hypothetical protein
LRFFEITDNRDVDEVVLTMEGGPYQEYFYVSVPVSMGVWRRFVYVQDENMGGANMRTGGIRTNKFPMQFGQSLAAHMLGCPEKSRWQDNVVSDAEEGKMCEEFRGLFEAYEICDPEYCNSLCAQTQT